MMSRLDRILLAPGCVMAEMGLNLEQPRPSADAQQSLIQPLQKSPPFDL